MRVFHELVGERVEMVTGLFLVLKSTFDCQAQSANKSSESDLIDLKLMDLVDVGAV